MALIAVPALSMFWLAKVRLFGKRLAIGAGVLEAEVTVNVKFCTKFAPTPLCAVNVIGNVPLSVGMPLSTPAVNVTPAGRVPVSDRVGPGNPVAITVNDPRAFIVNVALFALMIAGA
jgi:hypothetical protein